MDYAPMIQSSTDEGAANRSDVDDIIGLSKEEETSITQHTEESNRNTKGDKQEGAPKNDAMKKWREEIQMNIEAKKNKRLRPYRLKEKIEAKVVNSEDNTGNVVNTSGEEPFNWKKVADMLTKGGYTSNDQNSGPSQKMIDLIFTKAKE
ncbi:hypothetical protein X943_001084 [Babesia divergens]|uniref:Clathrin light chain n=1 Tax=Babesia divergens TaxID=32595 RepID=A0AAD9G6S0_BABDI|nr:hypothetical protein X943_001084 [Babesia divergens]